jgi:hypothetical protein
LFDNDSGISSHTIEVFVNGAASPAHIFNMPAGGRADPEEEPVPDFENEFNTYYHELPLSGCENVIKFVGTVTMAPEVDGGGDDNMARIDILDACATP